MKTTDELVEEILTITDSPRRNYDNDDAVIAAILALVEKDREEFAWLFGRYLMKQLHRNTTEQPRIYMNHVEQFKQTLNNA